jgi:hypothetical protein
MWLKIVAGLAAALAVVTVGVFVALPPTPSEGGCGGTCHTPAPKSECCSVSDACPGEVAVSTDAPCCSIRTTKPVDATALAACAGGMAVQPAPTAKFHCCDE